MVFPVAGRPMIPIRMHETPQETRFRQETIARGCPVTQPTHTGTAEAAAYRLHFWSGAPQPNGLVGSYRVCIRIFGVSSGPLAAGRRILTELEAVDMWLVDLTALLSGIALGVALMVFLVGVGGFVS